MQCQPERQELEQGPTRLSRSRSEPLNLLIRRLCRARPLPAHSALACWNATHWCAVDGSVERRLAAKKRPAWPDHLDILISRNNLANVYQVVGRTEEGRNTDP